MPSLSTGWSYKLHTMELTLGRPPPYKWGTRIAMATLVSN